MNSQQQRANRIWQVVQAIPAGRVASYGQIADLAGLPGRARLVGKVLGQAPKQMRLPWFRVVRASGQLAFAAASVQAQEQKGLLQQEDVVVLGNRIKLDKFGWRPDLSEILGLEF